MEAAEMDGTALNLPNPNNVWVLLRWNFFTGYYFVGPFATPDAAEAWIDDHNEDDDLCWQITRLDPTLSLGVRAPDGDYPLVPDPVPMDDETYESLERLWRELGHPDRSLPAWLGDRRDYARHDHWDDRQAPEGNYFVLMSTSDPAYLVGPFSTHRDAFSWGCFQAARGDANRAMGLSDDCDYGWQIIWLDDAARALVLRTPDRYRG
jgi:hypothetical protein